MRKQRAGFSGQEARPRDGQMLKTGETYVEQSAGEFEEQRRERELRQLARRASKLGLTLTPATPETALPAA